MYDFHLHTTFSFDAKSNPEGVIKTAIEKNFKTICFTDHLDYDANIYYKDYDFDIDEYFKIMAELRDKYRNEIEVLIGAEFGVQPSLYEKYDKIAKAYPFDFIILSIHTVEHHDLAKDGFPEKYEPLEVLKRYYSQMASCVKEFDDFDTLGHIDYIDRYFKDKSRMPQFKDYRDYVADVFESVIKKDKCIELNSAGKRRGLDYFHPKKEALELYYEMGGRLLTFGSDAHIETDFGKDFDEVIGIAKSIGFKELCIYRKREREYVKI